MSAGFFLCKAAVHTGPLGFGVLAPPEKSGRDKILADFRKFFACGAQYH
jgi:hypothetical protein